ncbi:hypothetical protein MRX96_032053 [Rhipicephalus microplus]
MLRTHVLGERMHLQGTTYRRWNTNSGVFDVIVQDWAFQSQEHVSPSGCEQLAFSLAGPDDGDTCDAGIEGRFAWMPNEVDWDWDRDFDFVHALELDVDRAFERDRPLFVSGVADASVVDEGE